MKRRIFSFFIAFMIFFVGITEATSPWRFVQETYIVKQDDTIEKVAEYIVQKNTYAKRTIQDCEEALVELNPFLESRPMRKGDRLKISYWVKGE